MNDLDPRLRHLFWFVAELFAALVSALALLLIVARLALPHADVFKPHIEAWFSQALGETVRIGAVNAHWPGLDLTVVLEGLITRAAALEPIGEEAVKYINRLSDHLFVLARWVNDRGTTDVLWVPGANR